jgi:hypothetical protein
MLLQFMQYCCLTLFQFQEFCASLCRRFWNLDLCKVPEQVLRTMFESTIDFIQFLFSEHITICFDPVTTLSIKIYLNSMNRFSVWSCNGRNLCQNLLLTFVAEPLFTQILYLNTHCSNSNIYLTCDILTQEITNLREWLFNTQDKYRSKN